MKACQDRVRELLPEFVQGTLEPQQMIRVADHLDGCAQCVLEESVLRRLGDEVLPEPPPWFWTSLPGKITSEADARRKRKMRLLVPAWTGGLAAAAIVVVTLLQPATAPGPQTPEPDFSIGGTAGMFPLGLEEEILPVSGMFIDDLDQVFSMDLNSVPDEFLSTPDLILEGDGYETMDEETIQVFEDLIDEMTPEGVGKKVMS